MVSNRDIGFVEAGQEAEIKVTTFNFTRYGLLHGRVLSVSQDAVGHDDPQEQTRDKAQGGQDAQRTPRNEEPVYAARVSLFHSTARRCKSRTSSSTSPRAWP
jgi:hemolysin D